MKKLLIPAVAAILAGLAGGSGFAFVNAKAAAKVVAAHVADSLAKHVIDSTATADSVAKVEHEREIAAAASEIPMTPADSIRLAQNQPTTLAEATHGLPNAVDPKHPGATPAPASSAGSSSHSVASTAPSTAKATPVKPPTTAAAKVPASTHAATPTVEPAHTPVNAPEPVESALPERRLSKIFGSMQSKDAAKVLEQMSDNDIRVILGMMGDKQAAAILTAMPAARAAAISKGNSRGETGKATAAKDEKKPGGDQP